INKAFIVSAAPEVGRIIERLQSASIAQGVESSINLNGQYIAHFLQLSHHTTNAYLTSAK
ncbi:hypothetical protein, partial [Pseudomonas coleopterorum]|uniref:hypothetical protein n=1 Tax=Pseudomonas coleopterorum TaxID=1605838 RepID=UPI0028B00A55